MPIKPDADATATIFVDFVAPAAAAFFSNWLCDKLKSKGVMRVRINQEEIEMTADGIKQKLESIEKHR